MAEVRIADGQLDFSLGVDSSRATTIAGPNMPNGLPRNAVSWANNSSFRGGGITQRTGYTPICVNVGGAITYYIGFTSDWDIPAEGETVAVTTVTAYPGSDGDQGTLSGKIGEDLIASLGTFVIVSGAGTTSLTLRLVEANVSIGTTVIGDSSTWPFNTTTPIVEQCYIHAPTGLFQGAWMYMQTTGIPYLIVAISGRFYRIRVDTDNSMDDITGSVVFPADQPLYHFTQGEEFMVVQAGDYTTLPAFWDGTTMRQSVGLNPGGGQTAELPAAGPMVYYQGRIWYANYRYYTAGDIVGGPSGTTPGLRDSILKVTENPLALGGDGFSVPTQAGNIRALQYVTNMDKSQGEGTLFVYTRQQVYAMDVPISRNDWINASRSNAPLQRVVQRNNGGVSDRSIVAVNGDLFYQSLEPGIRSLFTSLRYFNQWGNTPISNNINRALAFNDRSLMRFSTGIEFDSRLYMGILPEQREQGVVHRGIATLDFDPITTLQEKTPPDWEGIQEGLDVLQLMNGDFGGRERAFAFTVSREDSSIQLWEITNSQRFDNVDTRVDWYVEFPAYTWGREFDMKKLDGGELWVDKLFGTVDIKVHYRPDADPCWYLWHVAKICTARSSCEDLNNPVCYPLETYRESGKVPIQFPVPPLPECSSINARPTDLGFQFQVKVSISGWCRIRGLIVYATPWLKQPFGSLQCVPGPLSLPT